MNLSKQIKYPLAQAKTSWQLVVLGMLVGFLASLAIISLRLSIDFVQSFYMPVVDDYSQQSQYGRLIAPFIGALIIVFIAFITKSRYHRMGIPFVLYRQRKFYGYIPIGNSINQFFSAMAAIASGFSVGREGPAVHIGAGTASYLSQKLQLPDNAGRILTACGMAAGISASFNSPLAAVVFVLEVVLLQFRIHLFLPIMVSSLIGAAMSRLVFGNIQQFTDLSFPQITIESSLPFFALGIIVGLSAVLFNRSLLGIMKLSANVRMSIRLPLAGIIVGGIAWFVPNIMGTDIGALSIAFSDNPELSFLIMVLVGKFVATVCALGLGIPGGVIGVLYAIGALLGSVLVWSIIPFFPQLTPFASLTVMICMVAMMATSLNAPLAALVAVLEMSGNAAIIFPSLLVIVPAILLAQQFFGQKSLFFAQLDIQKLNYKTSPVMFSLQDTGVIALMRRKFTLFSDDQPWKEHDSSRLPLIKIEASEPQYFMPSNLMGYGDDNIVLTQLQTLPANATLAEAYRCLKELRRGYILILSQNEQRPIGLISWRALLKHLHVTQKS